MNCLEDLYKALGFKRPFNNNGELSKQGIKAEEKLLEFLNCCHDIGLIEEFDEDKFDKSMYMIINY